MRSLNRYRRLLRAASLVLLVLGMVISPALAALGDLHGLEHAAAAVNGGEHKHEHAHPADADLHDHHGGDVAPGADPAPDRHPHPNPPSDPDHTTGAHGLLHLSASVSLTLPEAALDFPMAPMSAQLLPESSRFQLPRNSPSLPFRPPIA